MRKILLSMAAATFLLVGTTTQATAVNIDFGGLVGNNGDNFTSIVEDGFKVTDLSGGWVEAHFFGNPVPSIFNREDSGMVDVTTAPAGTPFVFNSVDLGNANPFQSTFISYFIQGFLNNNQIFSQGATIGSQITFTTIASVSGSFIDRLKITIDGTGTSSYNIDNINVDAVPEPGTILLFGSGLAGLGLWRYRKRVVKV